MMAVPSPSLQSLLSPLICNPTTKNWLFPSNPTPPLPPTSFSKGVPISIQQETLCNSSTLASGTNVEQLIIPSHHTQHLLYGYVYATGAKYSEAHRERRRRQSSPHALKARFCYDSLEREFVLVQEAIGRKGVMSFQRFPNAFKKCFFLVECADGDVGSCVSARCIVGETDENCDGRNDVSQVSRIRDGNDDYDVWSQEFRHAITQGDTDAEQIPSDHFLSTLVAELQTALKGSFFSLSSTEYMLCGQRVTKRNLGRELTIVGDADAMMVDELRRCASSLHFADNLSPRVEERMDIGVRRRLAAWRSLQRRNLRDTGERWELKALKELRSILERRYEVVRKEGEMLRSLLES